MTSTKSSVIANASIDRLGIEPRHSAGEDSASGGPSRTLSWDGHLRVVARLLGPGATIPAATAVGDLTETQRATGRTIQRIGQREAAIVDLSRLGPWSRVL